MKDSNYSDPFSDDGYKPSNINIQVLKDKKEYIEDKIITVKKKLSRTDRSESVGRPKETFISEVERYAEEIDDVDLAWTLQYAQKPVVGAPNLSRIEYIQKAIEFTPWDEEKQTGVPPVVAEELRRLLPGLGAQESRFDAARVSRSGARGIMQFMPKTWASYGGKPEEITSLKRQVEIGGPFISDLYRQLRVHVGEETLSVLQSRFASEEDFLRQAMVPFVLNSYNAGAKRMSEAIKHYAEKTPVTKMPNGPELYIAIANFAEQSNEGKYLARYEKEQREYVPKIYAQTKRLFSSNETETPKDS